MILQELYIESSFFDPFSYLFIYLIKIFNEDILYQNYDESKANKVPCMDKFTSEVWLKTIDFSQKS